MRCFFVAALSLIGCAADTTPSPTELAPTAPTEPTVAASCTPPRAELEQVWEDGQWIIRGTASATCTGQGRFTIKGCLQRPNNGGFEDVKCLELTHSQGADLRPLKVDVRIVFRDEFRFSTSVVVDGVEQTHATDSQQFMQLPPPGQQ